MSRRSAREARQREEVAELERALEAFDDPQTAVRPGMQLMRDALSGKRDKLRRKLDEEEQVRLDIAVEGVPAAAAVGQGVDPAFLARLLTAVTEAVVELAGDAPAAATALAVSGWVDEGAGVVLTGPPLAVRSGVRSEDAGRPRLDAALVGLLDQPGPLAAVATEAGAVLRLTLHLPFEDERETTVP